MLAAVAIILIVAANIRSKRKEKQTLAAAEAANAEKQKEAQRRQEEKKRAEATQRRREEYERELKAATVKVEAQKAGLPVPAYLDAVLTGTLNMPAYENGMKCVYHYDDVPLRVKEGVPINTLLGQALSFEKQGEDQSALCGSVAVGTVDQEKLSRMIGDWQRNGDLIRAVITGTDDEKKDVAYFGLFFYRDQLQYMLKRNPDAKAYRLTGVKNEEIQSNLIGCQAGTGCTLSYDYDKEKYAVEDETGACIGYLPASAVDLVNQAGEDEVSVYIARVDEDDELRSIPYVYLFE